MKTIKRKSFNNFGKGVVGMHVAWKELKMPNHAIRVAGSQGVGSAIEHVRDEKDKRKAARKRQRQARRVNR